MGMLHSYSAGQFLPRPDFQARQTIRDRAGECAYSNHGCPCAFSTDRRMYRMIAYPPPERVDLRSPRGEAWHGE